MKRFVEGLDRGQSTLFPECLGDWGGADECGYFDSKEILACKRAGIAVEPP